MNSFPIPIPKNLPIRISPCPIVEAVVEFRFVGKEPWRNMPGIFTPLVREKYPNEKELPLGQLPEQIRLKESSFTYTPLLQYEGDEFIIRLGPRSLSVGSRAHQYPGWRKFRHELDWVWGKLANSNLVQEGERLGVRYIDFFSKDIFSLVTLDISVANRSVSSLEQTYTVVAPIEDSVARLLLANGVFLSQGATTESGSILDLDVWRTLSSEDPFAEAREGVEKLHNINKKVFFGLLRDSFLATLDPVYADVPTSL